MKRQPSGSVRGHKYLVTKSDEVPEIVIPDKQCIYKVSTNIRQANPKAYTPQVISIGPFHNPHSSCGANKILEPMEIEKGKYVQGFLKRTKLDVDYVLKRELKLEDWENRIRSCYAGLDNYNSNDFLQMILIDACFIIEYFFRYYRYKVRKEKDPLLKPHQTHHIRQDLILLENQLPFFVLEDIYNLTNRNILGPSFLKITFCYFKDYNTQNIDPERVRPKHFTDLLRTFMLPRSFIQGTTGEEEEIRHLNSASKLSEAGLVFQVNQESNCLLELKFHKGVLTMPSFQVDDSTEIYIRNLLAFEECQYHEKQYIAQYFKILDFLINTEIDVDILVENKIILNRMGDANAVASMVNNLCKNISIPYFNPMYLTLCKNLNGFYENRLNKYKASFMQEYVSTPWKIASTLAAVLLLLLTLIQTICSVISLA